MINQLTVLILLSAIFYAGTSLRHFVLAVGDGCNDCNCGTDDCYEDEEKKK